MHHTGGKWRQVQYHMAPSIDALLASQEKIGDQMDAKNNKALNQEAGKICNAHDDYIWRRVAGTTGPRGKAAFSTYYVCDQGREDQADALMKRVFAPMLDKMVAEGKLTTWGWMEHIVGGEYRRLATAPWRGPACMAWSLRVRTQSHQQLSRPRCPRRWPA